MTADFETRVNALRERIAAAQRDRIRAEHARDAAQAQAQRARQALHDEFGIATPEQARTLLAALQEQLADELAILNAELDKIGA